MKNLSKSGWIFFAVILLTMFTGISLNVKKANECEARGGVMARPMFSWSLKCLKNQEV